MHFSPALIALIAAGLANAQGGLPDLPPCSLNCFVSALGDDGCTPLTNFKCHCKVPGLADKITPCVKDACDIPAQSSVSNIVVSECKAAGEPISLPPVEGASNTDTAGPTASATGTNSQTGTGATNTGTGVGPASETGTASATSTASSSSVPVGSSSSAPSGSSGSGGSSGGSGSGSSGGSGSGATGSNNGPGSTTGPPAETSSVGLFPGAASNVKSNMAGVIALAVAAVYML